MNAMLLLLYVTSTLKKNSYEEFHNEKNSCGTTIPYPLPPQPRPQGFSLKKWVGREKALASAGHVHSLNTVFIRISAQPRISAHLE